MTDKSRQQEDRSSILKNTPGSSPPLQAGSLMPHHHFGIPSESSLGLTTPHPLAYGIMHQPIGPMGPMGRVTPASNDLGPPIFMPSLNLGVPRQTTATLNQPNKAPKNSLTQPPIMATSFMSEVTFTPSPIIFHPSQVRQSSQTPYLSPASPVNMKHTTKAGPTKTQVPKSQTVVRPTPKQPTSLPPVSHTKSTTSNTLSRPSKGESPGDTITYVHSPPGSSYIFPPQPVISQKGSTLSKMLMTPAQQQTSVVSSAGLQQKGVVDIGVAYVSHNTTLKSAVPSLTSIAAGSHSGKTGSFTNVPDSYPVRLSDHVTTSGQPTSTASFSDTKTERSPQPAAVSSPSSQPLPQMGTANKDKSIIIKGSSLTGRHIAAITNNTTLQHSSASTVQPAYATTPGSVPHTVDSVKMECGPADTGWGNPTPPDPTVGGAVFSNQVSGKTGQSGGGVSVPTVTAPGVLGLSTHTHSPGGSNLLNSPVRHTGMPHPQILRKRPFDGGLPQGEFPLSPTADSGVASHNHIGSSGDLLASPRKKPRKQNMVANDDLYASNVPDSLSSSSASSLDTPLSVEGSEESGRSLGNTSSIRSSRVKRESSKDGASTEVEFRYLSQLRRCPYPISSVHKVCHKAPHNHFKQHSDIKHKDEAHKSAVQLATDRYAHQRAEGWRVHHVLKQVEEMAKVEQELLDMDESLRLFSDDLRSNSKCVVEPHYIDNFKELIECNAVRSTRILSHMESTRTKSLQLLEHGSQVVELLSKCSPPSFSPSPFLTNHHKTRS